MKNTEYLSVSQALEALKKINYQENEIFEYVKTRMKFHANNVAESDDEKNLKDFWDYVGGHKNNEITLPIFNRDAE